MLTRILFGLLLLVVACSRTATPWSQILPGTLEGGWKLGTVTDLPSSEAPARIPALGLSRSALVRYAGAGEMRLRIYEMKTGPSAFELMQGWKQDDGLALYQGRYFAIFEPSALQGEALGQFARAFVSRLPS